MSESFLECSVIEADIKQFPEYQRLVQHIRRRAETDNDTLKAENKKLQDQITSLRADFEDMDHALERESTEVVQLKSQNSTLRSANAEAKERFDQAEEAHKIQVKGLQDEMKELRAFKQKVKGLF